MHIYCLGRCMNVCVWHARCFFIILRVMFRLEPVRHLGASQWQELNRRWDENALVKLANRSHTPKPHTLLHILIRFVPPERGNAMQNRRFAIQMKNAIFNTELSFIFSLKPFSAGKTNYMSCWKIMQNLIKNANSFGRFALLKDFRFLLYVFLVKLWDAVAVAVIEIKHLQE